MDLHGYTHVPGIGRNDLCLIRVVNGQTDHIGPGLSPSDFDGWYPGRVTQIGPTTELPQRVRAVFSTRRITQHPNLRMRILDNQEPPFAYEVRPLYRLQGITKHNGFEVGSPCVIHIGNFVEDDELCENPGLKPANIRRMVPPDLRGLWHGRVIQITGAYTQGDETFYRIAAAIEDNAITLHDLDTVRRWAGVEPPMRYVVWPNNMATAIAASATQGWNDFRRAARDGWRGLMEDLGVNDG